MSFVLSGLMKLFGFIPFSILAAETLLERKYKEFAIQLGTALALTMLAFLPYLGAGIEDFYVGFVLRFLGLSGAKTRNYNIFAALSGVRFAGSSPFVWLGLAIIPGIFLIHRTRSKSTLQTILLSTIVASAVLDLFSQSEPQWFSWMIPLTILYAYIAHKEGLANYTYFYGIMATLLTTTLLQTTGYLVEGVPYVLFNAFEGMPGSLLVYSITTISLLAVLLGYVFYRPVRFKLEVPVLIGLVYLQAYFWFTVMRIVPV